MAKKAMYKLVTFDKNDFMSWTITSQAGSKANIVLRDDDKIYFSVKKDVEDHNLLLLEQGSALYEGGSNLRIELEVHSHPDLNITQNNNAYSIITSAGDRVGSGYTICIEDHLDADFNDYFFSIVAWKKKG